MNTYLMFKVTIELIEKPMVILRILWKYLSDDSPITVGNSPNTVENSPMTVENVLKRAEYLRGHKILWSSRKSGISNSLYF